MFVDIEAQLSRSTASSAQEKEDGSSDKIIAGTSITIVINVFFLVSN